MALGGHARARRHSRDDEPIGEQGRHRRGQARLHAGGERNGAPYASFTFRVSDGDEESVSTYTMAIDVAPVNDPATGKPTVSGTAEVAHTLTASTSAIADADGLSGTFVYRWMRVDGATETVISGATRSRYVLTSADEGMQLKVEASFTTAAAPRESMTSDATATVAASTNTKPTASHGTVTTDEDTDYTFEGERLRLLGGQRWRHACEREGRDGAFEGLPQTRRPRRSRLTSRSARPTSTRASSSSRRWGTRTETATRASPSG